MDSLSQSYFLMLTPCLSHGCFSYDALQNNGLCVSSMSPGLQSSSKFCPQRIIEADSRNCKINIFAKLTFMVRLCGTVLGDHFLAEFCQGRTLVLLHTGHGMATPLKPACGHTRRKPAVAIFFRFAALQHLFSQHLSCLEQAGASLQDSPGTGQFLDQRILQGDTVLKKEGRTSAQKRGRFTLGSEMQSATPGCWFQHPDSKVVGTSLHARRGKSNTNSNTTSDNIYTCTALLLPLYQNYN